MRHGDVTYVRADGSTVDPDTVDLSEEGLRQARAVHQAMRDVPIDRAIASGLRRTVATAEIVLGGRDLDVEVAEDFEEVRIMQGETVAQLAERVVPAFERLLADTGWSDLLLVAHGVANRAILASALGGGTELYGRIEQDPACLNLLDVEPRRDGGWHVVVRAMNVTAYDVATHELRDSSLQLLMRPG